MPSEPCCVDTPPGQEHHFSCPTILWGDWADDEDPEFTYEDWRTDVIDRNTRLGYADWVEHQKET